MTEPRPESGRPPSPLYERAGGSAPFLDLVHRFYAGVAVDPVLRPLYPDDLAAAERRLALFLIQFAGGPADYEAERGPAKLRLRHLEFPIDATVGHAWLTNIRGALDESELAEPERVELWAYLTKMAAFFVNRGLSIGGSR